MRSFCALRWRSLVVSVLGICLLAWTGCSSSGLSGPTGTVTGKVTYNDKPVPAGTGIVFVNQDNAMAAVGQVEADGSYTLRMQGEPNVLAGSYKISVNAPVTGQNVVQDPEAYKAIMTGQAKPPRRPRVFRRSTSPQRPAA